jgi:Ca-activated chloride channel family protein
MNAFWDKLDPGFLAPVWLLVGLLAVIAVMLLEIGDERRRRQALRLFAAPHLVSDLTGSVSPVKRFWKKALFLAGIAFLFIALARPHLFYQWQEENRTGIDLLVAVDCSKSMLTDDVKPSRLERAKLAIADFADHLPDDRLGLIAFAGDAFLQVPLTLDHDAFQTAVRELDTDTIPRPGTDISTAIDQAVQALKSQAANAKILILITDGEDLEGRVLNAARAAAQSGLKIYTVGVGTPAGGLIPEQDETGSPMYLHDSSGQIVQSRLDESTLKQIATLTGGAYAALGQRGEGLEEIYRRYIEPMPRRHLESRREKIRFERYEWPLSLSILLLVASSLINERAAARRPVPIEADASAPSSPRRRARMAVASGTTALLALLVLPGFGATTDQAERDYKSGKYQQAAENYQQAADQQPNRHEWKYNLGDAAYKAGEYSQAEEAFRKTLETPDLNLQEQTYYNLGNAQFRHGEAMEKDDKKRTMDLWQQALTSYEGSMKLKMSADARHNYEFVKKKLEELKQQQQQQQNQQKNNSSDPNDKNSSSGGGGSKQNPSNSQDKDQQQKGGGNPQDQNGQDQQQNGQQPDSSNKGGEQNPGSSGSTAANQPQQARSGSREQDQTDPGAKSRQDAEALLDSLKDDEKHVTARTLNGNNEPPPPPPSGKDW